MTGKKKSPSTGNIPNRSWRALGSALAKENKVQDTCGDANMGEKYSPAFLDPCCWFLGKIWGNLAKFQVQGYSFSPPPSKTRILTLIFTLWFNTREWKYLPSYVRRTKNSWHLLRCPLCSCPLRKVQENNLLVITSSNAQKRNRWFVTERTWMPLVNERRAQRHTTIAWSSVIGKSSGKLPQI